MERTALGAVVGLTIGVLVGWLPAAWASAAVAMRFFTAGGLLWMTLAFWLLTVLTLAAAGGTLGHVCGRMLDDD